ncbi:MAG: signal peptidase I [Bryobacteraceae bacterium]|jgi:signal peptidase I
MACVETMEQTGPLSRWTRFREMTRDVRRGFIAEWTVTIILLLFATTTLVQAFVIPSASMEDSLLIGDHVLVDKLVYAPPARVPVALPYRDVRRGDVIVFRYPLDISQDYVKRAIGVPGDRIRFVNQQLILNGKPVREPYVKHVASFSDVYRDNFPASSGIPPRPRAMEMLQNDVVNGELVVPSGYVFAMGDNRDDSDDSRYWGMVPRENIVGTPVIVYWSYDATTQDLTNGNIGFDHIVDVVMHFFTKTRWKRTFNLIHGYPLR